MGTRADLLILMGLFALIWFYSRVVAYYAYRPMRRSLRRPFDEFAVPKPHRQESERDGGPPQPREDTTPSQIEQREATRHD